MNEHASKWWIWGLAGVVFAPIILLAINGWINRALLSGGRWPELDALFLSIAATTVILGLSVIPVPLWLRFVLVMAAMPLAFFVHCPL